MRSLKEYALAAEIVGAAAVVISLIYVGVSVNQNTNAVMVANHQALVSMDQNTTDWLRDPDLANAYLVANDGIDILSDVQRVQVGSYVAGKMNTWEFAFITRENGMMDVVIWEGWDGHFRSVLRQPAGRSFWDNERGNFSASFRRYVDSIVAEIE